MQVRLWNRLPTSMGQSPAVGSFNKFTFMITVIKIQP